MLSKFYRHGANALRGFGATSSSMLSGQQRFASAQPRTLEEWSQKGNTYDFLLDQKGAPILRENGRPRFDPTKIIPTEAGDARVCDVTGRDGKQSRLAGKMAPEHQLEDLRLVRESYRTIQGPPGYIQTSGGTTKMFDSSMQGMAVQTFDYSLYLS